MFITKWDKLPEKMKSEEVRGYYDILAKKKFSLLIKRVFDVMFSAVLLAALSPLFLVLAVAIKADSKGPVFFRQKRVTRDGKVFRIFKFRSMVSDADKKGTLVTLGEDKRITRVGKFIRKFRLDEISQLIDVFRGKMTFVGTRPEVEKYVDKYTPEMYATLLLPAGITSEASIKFKDEDKLLSEAENADEVYVSKILPEKMKYNLAELKKFGLGRETKTLFKTVGEVFFGGKKENGEGEK